MKSCPRQSALTVLLAALSSSAPAALYGCSSTQDSFVVVHADVDCDVPRVYQMSVTISNAAGQDQKLVPTVASAELGFPSSFVLVLPESTSGDVEVAVDALDQSGSVVGQGMVDGQVKAGSRVDLKVQLSVPSTSPGNTAPTGSTDGGVPPRDSGSPGGRTGSYVQIAVHNGHTCAIRDDSSLWCWGGNSLGEIRLDSASNRLTPVNVGGVGAWGRVATGQSHSCGVRADATLSCWGNNGSGQLGGTTTGATGRVEVPGNGWATISAGSYQSCGVQVDGTLWCWGDNTSGQLGDGSLLEQPEPVQVGGSGFAAVSTNFLHTCATKADHRISCWGLNADAQTGDLNGTYHASPVTLDGADWTSVSTGLSHTCALRADGTLWCWGGNKYGQLGSEAVGAAEGSSSAQPIQVGSAAWQSVAAGQSYTCGIMLDGSLWCWGDNSAGQLGIGSLASATVPTQVPSSVTAWAAVATGTTHTCALATDGTAWCWGDNSSGQLGAGSTSPHLTPVRVVQ